MKVKARVGVKSNAPPSVTGDAVASPDIGSRLAARLHELRVANGYSLDTLAAKSGVSRSAISMIERNLNSPTAVVLDKLAAGLGVTLGSLFDTGRDSGLDTELPEPIARRTTQPRWKDPQSGYVRRNVSPPNWASPIRIVEVEFPAGAAVAYETAGRDVTVHQQVWVLSGEIEILVGPTSHSLTNGDCLAMMMLDQPITFRNTSTRAARYAVVSVSEPTPARRAAS